jgi:hypothetical protein
VTAGALAVGAVGGGAWIAAACLLAVTVGLGMMVGFEGAMAVGSWAAAHERVQDTSP